MKRALALLLTLALFTIALPSLVAVQGQRPVQQSRSDAPAAKFRRVEGAIPNQYIVAFNDDTGREEIAPLAKKLARLHGGKIMFIYTDALKGFAAELPEAAALALSNNPQVAYVEESGVAYVAGAESTPDSSGVFWGIDRIDQRDLPLSQTYDYNRAGSGVHAYVLDTGIWITHVDFGTRAHTATDVGGGYDSFGGDGIDRNNHGTFVAGVIGGRSYGVAKNVQLHSVKVCDDSGSCPIPNVIAGINWVINNHTKPAVINMSFGGAANTSLDNAVRNATAAGITCVVSAGNDNRELVYESGYLSPGRVSQAITVGATTKTDSRASYSNYGSALDIFAPGGQAPSHYIPVPASGYFYGGANNVSDGFTGTSAAAPHVTGVVALYLEQYSLYSPNDPATLPANVSSAITGNATPDRLSGLPESCYWDYETWESYCYPTSPNLLLYSSFVAPPASNPIDDTRFFVRQQYYDFLRRTPDALWEDWISFVNGCNGDAQCLNSRRITMTRGVIESLEFKQRNPILLNNSPGTQAYNAEYVRQLYVCLLQREPDGAQQAWLDYINNTGDYDGLVGGFINSAEYRLRFV